MEILIEAIKSSRIAGKKRVKCKGDKSSK